MKKLKTFVLMIIMVMAIFLFAGCGTGTSGGAAGGNADTQTQTEEQTEGVLHEDETSGSEAADAAQSAADQYNDGDIGIDAVKAIVLAKVSGATESDIYELETEYDDGRLEYEGSLYYGGYEYEFEIDAATGNILAWEIDD